MKATQRDDDEEGAEPLPGQRRNALEYCDEKMFKSEA